MNVSVAVADLPSVDNLRLVGGTQQLVVLEADGRRYACDRETGAPAEAPASFVELVEPDRTAVDGIELALRAHPTPAVMRGGRVAYAFDRGARAVLVPGVGALAIEASTVSRAPALVPVAIRASGKLVVLEPTLPSWTVHTTSSRDLDPTISWTVHCEPTARVVVIATPHRASWLTFETIAAIAAIPEKVGVGVPLVSVVVARRPELDLVNLDTSKRDCDVWHRTAADTRALAALTPGIMARMAELRALAAPNLDDDRIAELTGAIASRLGPDPARACGEILGAFFETETGSDHLVGPHCVMRAAVANAAFAAARDPKRFVPFWRYGPDPIFIAVVPGSRDRLDALLCLGPEPPPVPTDLTTALVELANLDAASFVVTRDGGLTRLTLTHDAALALATAS
jgi:hypothetical protein